MCDSSLSFAFNCVRVAAGILFAAAVMLVSCEKPEPELLPPSSVKAELVGENVVVAWDAAGSGLCYEILRKEGVGEFSVISGAPVEGLSFTDAKIPDDSVLTYAVRSVSGDKCSQPSKPSNQIVKFLQNLKASALEYTDRIVVTWAPYDGATKYVVYRFSTAAPAPVVIGTPASCEWIDTTAAPDTPYFYQVSWMENTTEKGTSGPVAAGIYSQVKDYYEPNNDYRDIDSQSASSVFTAGSPPVTYSFADTSGKVYADTDWYKYVGPAIPVMVTVTVPSDSSFNDGELLFSFMYNNVLSAPLPLRRGNNTELFDGFGTATGNVSLYFRVTPSVPSSRQVIGTYAVSMKNGI